MVDKPFFERSSTEVAEDLGLRVLRFSKKGLLHVPKETKSVVITQIVPYGTEQRYQPERTANEKLKKSVEKAFREPGVIDMYFGRFGYVLAISTGKEGEYSEISIHGAFPLSGFDQSGLHDLLGPLKLTKEMGIDKQMAIVLDGQPIYDNPMIQISDAKLSGTSRFDPKKVSPSALGSYYFSRSR